MFPYQVNSSRSSSCHFWITTKFSFEYLDSFLDGHDHEYNEGISRPNSIGIYDEIFDLCLVHTHITEENMVAREPPKKLTIREESRDGPEEQQKTVSCNQRTYSILLKILVYLNNMVLNFFGLPSDKREWTKWTARKRTIHRRRNFVSTNFQYLKQGISSAKPEMGGIPYPRTFSRAQSTATTATVENIADPNMIKPHVFQLAYHALEAFANPKPKQPQEKKSFFFEPSDTIEEEGMDTEEIDGEEIDGKEIDRISISSNSDEDLFDHFGPSDGLFEGEEETDQPSASLPLTRRTRNKISESEPNRRHPKVKRLGGFDDVWKHEGLTGLILRFRFARHEGESRGATDLLFDHRPYFCYWVTVVQVIILIVALSVYGFAPIGLGIAMEPSDTLDLSLDFRQVERNITQNVWGGPSQESLVLLGAKYAPCMRSDRQLMSAFDKDKAQEEQTGCCVYNEGSGCYQAPQGMCTSILASWVYEDEGLVNTSQPSRVVCGQSPRTCRAPISQRPNFWSEKITEWPICLEVEDSNVNNSQTSFLNCNPIGRPCCLGIQAQCMIATQDACQFMGGKYHPEATLCAQIDCFEDVCGLLPFGQSNHPDQVYRLWIALFLHSGIFQIIPTIFFHFTFLRDLERHLGWLRTCIIYIGSGVFGNLLSAVITPYYPSTGPYGCIMGIIASFIVFIILEENRIDTFKFDLLKIAVIIVVIVVLGLLPYVDQWAHLGGLVMGFLLGGMLMPYIPAFEEEDISEKKERRVRVTKYICLAVSIPLSIIFFVIFLVVFYVSQPYCDWCSYLTCPFQEGFTVCIDQTATLRARG